MLNHSLNSRPADKLTETVPRPRLGPNGKYPIPEPGVKKDREY
jgi:hypothetical protein